MATAMQKFLRSASGTSALKRRSSIASKSYMQRAQDSYYNSDAPQKGLRAGRAIERGRVKLSNGRRFKVLSNKKKSSGGKTG